LTSITINDQKFRPSFLIVFVDVEVLDLYRQIDFQSMTALAQVSKDKLPLASLNR